MKKIKGFFFILYLFLLLGLWLSRGKNIRNQKLKRRYISEITRLDRFDFENIVIYSIFINLFICIVKTFYTLQNIYEKNNIYLHGFIKIGRQTPVDEKHNHSSLMNSKSSHLSPRSRQHSGEAPDALP